jgi:hypothetical protein
VPERTNPGENTGKRSQFRVAPRFFVGAPIRASSPHRICSNIEVSGVLCPGVRQQMVALGRPHLEDGAESWERS